jgi:hypothetical protein
MAFSQTLQAARYSWVMWIPGTSNGGFPELQSVVQQQSSFNFTQPLSETAERSSTAFRSPGGPKRAGKPSTIWQILIGLSLSLNSPAGRRSSFANLRVQESSDWPTSFCPLKANSSWALSPSSIFSARVAIRASSGWRDQARIRCAADDAIRKQIGADLDPSIRALPIVLTDAVLRRNHARGRGDHESFVIASRLKSATQDLDVDDLQIRRS